MNVRAEKCHRRWVNWVTEKLPAANLQTEQSTFYKTGRESSCSHCKHDQLWQPRKILQLVVVNGVGKSRKHLKSPLKTTQMQVCVHTTLTTAPSRKNSVLNSHAYQSCRGITLKIDQPPQPIITLFSQLSPLPVRLGPMMHAEDPQSQAPPLPCILTRVHLRKKESWIRRMDGEAHRDMMNPALNACRGHMGRWHPPVKDPPHQPI